MSYYSYGWRPYVPVAQRRANAYRKIQKLKKKGENIQPVEIEGRAIAKSFWGKAWCDHLESFSDFENRLPRGRTYVRNGSVCHLDIDTGLIEAFVSGSELYKIKINIKPLKSSLWDSIKKQCTGKIGSMLELLQGKLSDHVMSVVTHRDKGLMPQPDEIKLNCSCPDWATMCKHVAAALYGIGSRLDNQPELLFKLRGVDANELITAGIVLPDGDAVTGKTIADDQLADIFDIDLENDSDQTDVSVPAKKRQKRPEKTERSSRKKPAVSLSDKPIRRKKKSAAAMSRNVKNSDLPRIRPTGKSIARLRKKLKLSVPKFAQALNVSTGSIYRWEKITGPLKLNYNTFYALARLYQ